MGVYDMLAGMPDGAMPESPLHGDQRLRLAFTLMNGGAGPREVRT